MKKIIFALATVLSVFIIYLATMDRKVYYLALGDSNMYNYDIIGNKVYGYSYYLKDYLDEKGVLEDYVYGYSSYDKRISDIIKDIKDNRKYKDYTLKNSLIKADLVTLHLNGHYLFEKLSDSSLSFDEMYDYVDDLTGDLEKLFSLLRQYCKEDIVFAGYNNPFINSSSADILDVMDYVDKRFKEVCLKYDVSYVSLNNLNLSTDLKYLEETDYKTISSKIIDVASKKLFET